MNKYRGTWKDRYRFLWLFLTKRRNKSWNWWCFWNFDKLGFTELTYKGIPIILRDDIPKDTMLIHQTDNTWKSVNIKTRRISTLKNVT